MLLLFLLFLLLFLWQVSSKRDNFDYAMKSIDWELPEHVKAGYAPIKLAVEPASLLEEKFTLLKDYLFNDEGGVFCYCYYTA